MSTTEEARVSELDERRGRAIDRIGDAERALNRRLGNLPAWGANFTKQPERRPANLDEGEVTSLELSAANLEVALERLEGVIDGFANYAATFDANLAELNAYRRDTAALRRLLGTDEAGQ